MDLDARLPPRKRLLAGSKLKDSPPSAPDYSLSLPIPSISTELYRRLQKILSSSSCPVENIVHEINSVASDATEAAAAARAKATEKAEAAVKAKAAAKRALESVASIRDRKSRRPKKRRVEIKNLYGNSQQQVI